MGMEQLFLLGMLVNVVLFVAAISIIVWIRNYLNRVDERAQRAEDREILALSKKEEAEESDAKDH
jgi:F0F1-type ATP synthase membrane subunit b/b'